MAKAPADIRSLARAHCGRALQVLAGIMDEPKSPPASRIAAAEALLARGYGKPTQPIGGDGEPITIRQIITGVPRADDDKANKLANHHWRTLDDDKHDK